MPCRGAGPRWIRALTCAGLLAAGPVLAATASVVPDPGCATWLVVSRADVVLYPLPHGFLRTASDSVTTRAGAWVRGRDYLIDPARGVLRLLRQPVAGESLWVSACYLLSAPPPEHQVTAFRPARAPLDTTAADTTRGGTLRPRPITDRIPAEAPEGSALALSGNKTIAVEFGSGQDAALKQSLDLAVTGTLAPGVELTGVLSDRNVGLNATGATEGLQSLDRLLLQVKSPQGTAELGDLALKVDQGEFAKLDRSLQGVDASWHTGSFSGVVAAASAQGQYRRMEFPGIEGQQGPYTLTGVDGGGGITVITGSETVTLDGERLQRGESADYSIDYDRGLVTFTNRRPITSASRIAVEFQYSLDGYHRNLALASGGWKRGPWWLGTTWLTESDDRGRPISGTLDAGDELVLASAGDSATRAIGAGVTAGPGDYILRQGATGPYYAFAGPDSGAFIVSFSSVGIGAGDYAESTVVAGRIIYRYTGPGAGDAVIGRRLPLPQSHQLGSLSGGVDAGLVSMRVDGAFSKLDRNTWSSLDDGDDAGHALDARLRVGGVAGARGPDLPRAGIELHARDVDPNFSPFGTLEAPYTEESWGLAPGADLDHQRRTELTGFVRDPRTGELTGYAGVLETPDDYRAFRRSLGWTREGAVSATASWDRADGTQPALLHPDGGRDLEQATLRWRSAWLEPSLRAVSDERWVPSDSVRSGARTREIAADLAAPSRFAWHGHVGLGLRRDGIAATTTGFSDQTESRSLQLGLDSPAGGLLGGSFQATRRDQQTLAGGAHTLSDLASLLLHASEPAHGLSGQYGLQVTSEGETPRSQVLAFVGPGRGAYDSLGHFTGTGSYDLVLVNGVTLTRVARAATSARAGWNFGTGEVWRGSHVEMLFESDARRRGDLRLADLVLSPGAALGDSALARGSVLQRLDTELAPGSPVASLRLLLERRVSADRSFGNFDQTLEDRTASLRWRARMGGPWSSELETQWHRQSASQDVVGATAITLRTLDDLDGTAQMVFSPGARLRAVAAAELTRLTPRGGFGDVDDIAQQTLRLGPDLGLAVGARGRLDLGLRRGFTTGPTLPPLVPSIDPLGPPRWDANARFDYRLFEVATVSMSVLYQDRVDHPSQLDGRAEVRAFF